MACCGRSHAECGRSRQSSGCTASPTSCIWAAAASTAFPATVYVHPYLPPRHMCTPTHPSHPLQAITVHSPEVREPRPLSLHHLPLPITFALWEVRWWSVVPVVSCATRGLQGGVWLLKWCRHAEYHGCAPNMKSIARLPMHTSAWFGSHHWLTLAARPIFLSA